MHKTLQHSALTIRNVKIEDIGEVYKLLTANRPYVGLNSRYTYFLLARDFNNTCLVALDGDHIVAFASGYLSPTRSGTFFSWEIVVDEAYRGNGLQKLLLLNQLRLSGATFLECTVNPTNQISEKNFLELARLLNAECNQAVLFSEADFGNDGHEAEVLLRIGPFEPVLV